MDNTRVNTLEVVIWSGMMGALLLLACVAATDVLRLGSLSAWRGLAFVLLTGASAVLMTGLPEHVLQVSDERFLLPAKVAMGPLSGALALTYLGIWLGRTFEDRLLRVLVIGGSFALLASAMGMASWAALDFTVSPQLLIQVSAGVNFVSVVIAATVAMRGAVMGDSLARWMVLACVCLAVMVAGLYANALSVGAGLWLWALTAISGVAYFLIVTALTLVRNRNQKRLQRLARGTTFTDEITGLPMGSVLVAKVGDALWRSARVGRDSAVIAVWLNNIYDLSEDAGYEIEHEIRVRLMAMLRQAVGFRNVVGLLQARCFVVAISAVQDRGQVLAIAQRLLWKINRPLKVGDLALKVHDYLPQAGIGVVHIASSDNTGPLGIMDAAQKLAQQACAGPVYLLQQDF